MFACGKSVCDLHIMCLTDYKPPVCRWLKCLGTAEDGEWGKDETVDPWLLSSLICCGVVQLPMQCALSLGGKGHRFMAGGCLSAARPENLNRSSLLFPVKLFSTRRKSLRFVTYAFTHVSVYMLKAVSPYEREMCCMLSLGRVIICRYSTTPGAF